MMLDLMNDNALRVGLHKYGWIESSHPADVKAAQVETAVAEYQKWHGLRVDGIAGRVTQSSLEAPRFCCERDGGYRPDRMEVGDSLCKFDSGDVAWNTQGSLAQFTQEKQIALIAHALALWSVHADLRFTQVDLPNAANIILGYDGIDGGGRTLAWSELPCGGRQQVRQRYDEREPWSDETENPPQFSVSFGIVCAHEMGHALGLGHAPGSGSLMSAIYSPQINKPQAWDIREIVRRYGETDIEPPPLDPAGNTIAWPAVMGGVTGMIEQRFVPSE